MFIKHIRAKGILSFGPDGIDLPLGKLNVLIGPNGSGKSNLLELFALLKAAPQNLVRPITGMGGIGEWLWKGESGHATEATIDVDLAASAGSRDIRHLVSFTKIGIDDQIRITDERIEHAGKRSKGFYYRFQHGDPILVNAQKEEDPYPIEILRLGESILSQLRNPARYPVLASLYDRYLQIRLYRNWSFGPSALLRHEQQTQEGGEFLNDGGDNLVNVLHRHLNSSSKKEFKERMIESLNELYEGIEDINFDIKYGKMQLRLQESNVREISAARLSDGTLRYLSLLVILLHPDPPPLVVIEEPELGLHPDVIPHLVQRMKEYAERAQLIVTTHSQMLIEALSDTPEAVVVCERSNGQSQFERLDAERLTHWLKRYTLGTLWSMGEIGGNRW